MKLLSGSLYGEVLENTDVAGLKLTETSYMSSLTIPPHSHELSYFCFVLEGHFTEIYGRRSRSCKPSTLVFHPGGETHSDFFHADARCFNIQMNAGWLESINQDAKILNEPADFQGGLMIQLTKRLYRELRQADVFSPLIIEALTIEILIAATRLSAKLSSTSGAPKWLRQAKELLRERSCECLSLADIAKLVSVHPVHLAREFRSRFGFTVGEYIRQCRIEAACQKLSQSDLPITQIALETGFFDQSHFTRTFKQYTGSTPSEYRETFRLR